MKLSSLLLFIGIFTSFLGFGQEKIVQKDIDSLIRIHQPSATQKALWKWMDQAQNSNDQVALVKAIHNFDRILYPLENEEKATLYFKLLKRAQTFPEPSQTFAQMDLLNELAYQGYKWFPSAYIPLYDSIDFSDQPTRFQWMLQKMNKMEGKLNMLKQFSFLPYQETLLKGNDSLFISRTASDYIGYKLIDLYQSQLLVNGGTLKKAKDAKKDWYSETYHFKHDTFARQNLTTHILRLFQSIEKNNTDDLKYLSTAVYLRLRFLKENFNQPNWIKIAWESAYKTFRNSATRSKFLFEREMIAYNEGKTYHFKTHPEEENKLKYADSILHAELKEFPDNDFKYPIKALLHTIESTYLRVYISDIVPPQQKIPLRIDYRNLSQQILRIYKVNDYHPLVSKSLEDVAKNNQLALVYKKNIALKHKDLFQKRSKEILLDGLKEKGHYFVVVTDSLVDLTQLAKDRKKWREARISAKRLVVSGVSVAYKKSNDSYTILVANQKTGKPVKGAKVDLYLSKGYKKWKKYKSGKTNELGKAVFPILKYNRVKYIVSYKGAFLTGSDYLYLYRKPEKRTRVKLIADRSIYRPGQTVYFKGIVYTGKDNEWKIEPNQKVHIVLKDAGYQTVYKHDFTTNSYGSINGAIQLPKSIPLGSFQIRSTVKGNKGVTHSVSFRVEEYKRPTFEVKLNAPTTKANLNDTVTLSGNAKAFAGFPIDGANVSYAVYRKWYNTWRFYYSNSSSDLLSKGILKTDKNGEFKISFFAKTDPNATKNAYYNYEVKVKVTGISGEIHEQRRTIRLNKMGLFLQMDLPSQVVIQRESSKITPRVVNLSGKLQKGFTGKLRIYQLENPSKFVNRMWKNAEYSSISDEALATLFPYMKTNSYAKNPPKKLVKEIPFHSGDSLEIKNLLTHQQGIFQIEGVVLTKEGDTLKSVQTIEVIDEKAKNLPKNEPIWLFVPHKKVKVGGEAMFQVGTAFKNTKGLITLYSNQKIIFQKWVDLKNRFSFIHQVAEEDRGKLTVEATLFKDGKFYHKTQKIYVPFDNKKLVIKTATFRDKLQPGAKEQWRFTIKDINNNGVKAELAATMYDASLDNLYFHGWSIWPYNAPYSRLAWRFPWSRSYSVFGNNRPNWRWMQLLRNGSARYKDALRFSGNPYLRSSYYFNIRGGRLEDNSYGADSISSGEVVYPKKDLSEVKVSRNRQDKKAESAVGIVSKSVPNKAVPKPKKVVPRSNFNETAFFYPTIHADSTDGYNVQFTLPESLTKWKLLLMAHTKNMKVGTLQKEVIAQKELMITANAPRFLRQGDRFVFSAKVVNLTDTVQHVKTQLQLKNQLTNKNVDFIQGVRQKKLEIPAHGSVPVHWELKIGDINLLQYKITVENAHFSDGERNTIPVLSNRILVTATKHQILRDTGKTVINFKDFSTGQTPSVDSKSYTIEYVDNLAWNAILALPYLSEINNKSTTTLMNSYYANAIATKIIADHPRIKTIFEQWKNLSPDVLWSELQKNKAVKSILLNETPWVMDAKNEAEQRCRIALLFQLNQLENKQSAIARKLRKRQKNNGGFSWFKGGHASAYITQSILTRWGHLKQLSIGTNDFSSTIQKAEQYVNDKQIEYYLKYRKDWPAFQLSPLDVQWLYTRTFFSDEQSQEIKKLVALYKQKLKKDWTHFSPYLQAMAGIYCQKNGMKPTAQLIYASLLDRAHTNKLGMYWVENSGYSWSSNKVGTQSMIISFFQAMEAPKKTMDNARLWLILNKETNTWKTNAETAEAVFAILSTGRDYLRETKAPTIKVGKHLLVTEKSQNKNAIHVDWTPGIGQERHTWKGDEITPDLGQIEVNKTSTSPSAVSIFWQYTDELQKIKASQSSSFKVKKAYYRITPGAKEDEGTLSQDFKVGDKIRVVLTITVDRALDFVHIKDLRPAGFEPTDVLSGYHWGRDLSYYQSPKDASMNYFIEHLPKGSYRLSYAVYATHEGTFSSGIATAQCFYAPAFAGHSGAERIEIK